MELHSADFDKSGKCLVDFASHDSTDLTIYLAAEQKVRIEQPLSLSGNLTVNGKNSKIIFVRNIEIGKSGYIDSDVDFYDGANCRVMKIGRNLQSFRGIFSDELYVGGKANVANLWVHNISVSNSFEADLIHCTNVRAGEDLTARYIIADTVMAGKGILVKERIDSKSIIFGDGYRLQIYAGGNYTEAERVLLSAADISRFGISNIHSMLGGRQYRVKQELSLT